MNRLISLLYGELKAIARHQLRRYRVGESLNTTALVNETYVKLRESQRWQLPGTRLEFLGLAACVMRNITVDKLRAKATSKRGGGVAALHLDESLVASAQPDEQMLAIDEALRALEATDEHLVRLVECKFFAGYTDAEVAEIMGCSSRTVQRNWVKAKATLAQMMRESV